MDRRCFLALLVAGCADPTANLVPRAAAAPAPGEPPPPAPSSGPPESGRADFDSWARDFYGRAILEGLPAALLDRELAGLTLDPRVAALDSRQPEFNKPVGDYVRGVMSADRIAIGTRKRDELAFLPAIEAQYGVPREILIAIWALETSFGAIQGDLDVVRSMATLAAQGRRREFAEDQLIAALRIIESGEFGRERLRGSWAGAMGQTQMIPTTFRSTAVDGDGDGRRDVWTSTADALASAANLLAKAGWRRSESWAQEVAPPADLDYGLTEGPKETPDWWGEKKVFRADGLPWSPADRAAKAMLIAPAGATGPLFLVFPNHFAIRQYNNATAYALGVGLLADRMSGEAPLVRGWPAETPLSLSDRLSAQQALQALGFNPGEPDGVVGINTRMALRAWQQARKRIADGYLSLDMVKLLKAEVGLP